MALPKRELFYTPAEYLAFERAAKTKHEYLNGQVYVRASGSPTHNQICFNSTGAIGIQLKGTSCIGYTSDQKIRTDPMDLFSYPDLTVVCGKLLFHDKHKDVILNPTVIIEVLSPSTEEYDRKEKFTRYQDLRSLTDYILISQNRVCVEQFVRQKNKRRWLYSIESDLKAEIEIASISCKLKLADIYDRVVFPLLPAPLSLVTKKPAKSRKVKTTR